MEDEHNSLFHFKLGIIKVKHSFLAFSFGERPLVFFSPKRKTAPEGLLSRGGPSGAKTLTALSPEGATMEKVRKGFFASGGIKKSV